ncbi:MAG TPA: hypothetical protein VHV50_00190 [Actinomycetota bacterium]|nr:hypothetical protein [Actinomycetota bacterium]
MAQTATVSTLQGRCRHCGTQQSDLIRHLDEERARERRLFLLHDRLETPGGRHHRPTKGGVHQMMKLIAALALPSAGVIGIAIARGRDQMQRIEDLFQTYRTTL